MYSTDWPYKREPRVAELAAMIDGSPSLTQRLRRDFLRDNALALFPKFA